MSVEHDDDLEEFSEVAELLALGPSDVVDEQPSASLWAAIEAELGPEMASEAEDRSPRPQVLPSDEAGAPVVSLDAARSRRRLRVAIAAGVAAAVLLIGVPVGLALQDAADDPVEFAADASLSTVSEGFTGSGMAELADRELRVETVGLNPVDDAFYELWLLELVDGELNDLVSIGIIEADGTYVIDEDVDLDRFTVVDISLEPTDGDPTHSGNSLLRGELTEL